MWIELDADSGKVLVNTDRLCSVQILNSTIVEFVCDIEQSFEVTCKTPEEAADLYGRARAVIGVESLEWFDVEKHLGGGESCGGQSDSEST